MKPLDLPLTTRSCHDWLADSVLGSLCLDEEEVSPGHLMGLFDIWVTPKKTAKCPLEIEIIPTYRVNGDEFVSVNDAISALRGSSATESLTQENVEGELSKFLDRSLATFREWCPSDSPFQMTTHNDISLLGYIKTIERTDLTLNIQPMYCVSNETGWIFSGDDIEGAIAAFNAAAALPPTDTDTDTEAE